MGRGVRWSPEDVVAHGDGRYRTSRKLRLIWFLFGLGFCVFLVHPAVDAVTGDRPVAFRVLLLALVIGYGASYVVLSLWALGRPLAVRAAVIGWMLVLYVAVVVTLGAAHLDVATYALVVAAVLVGWPWSMAVCGAIVLGAIGLGAVIGSPVDQRALGLLVSVAVGSSLCAGAAGLFLAVREARAEIARLAVVQERERVYRDLHDVLGHHLTAITVKAGLARRLLEADAPDRVADEVADVERLGRDALAEVRATIEGRRVVPLAAEITAAREMLAAAGIEAELPEEVGDVGAGCGPPFGHVVREGVTNVIRHSGATRCTVRVGSGWVEVTDDGRGSAAPPGNGLTGLARRLDAVGGRLDAGPCPGGGFRLRAVGPGRAGTP